MKKLVFNLLIALFILPTVMNAGTPAKNETTAKKYNAYWVATAGSEKIILGKISTTEDAIIRNENGDPEYLNMQLLDDAFNFSYLAEFEGKTITAHQYVVVNEEAELIMNSAEMNADFANPCPAGYNLCQATYACYAGYSQVYDRVVNSCSSPKSKVCIAFASKLPMVAPYYYIISCK